MGCSPYTTLKELFDEKTGKGKTFQGNFATERGVQSEPLIRDLYIKLTGRNGSASTGVFRDWTILRASFDFISDSNNALAEFKYPAARWHELAKLGKVPYHYYPQCQTQMLVAGFSEMDYVSYDGQEIVIVQVKADPEYQRAIVSQCKRFWDYVQNKKRIPKQLFMEPGPYPLDRAEQFKERLVDDDWFHGALTRFIEGTLSPSDFMSGIQIQVENYARES